MSEPLMNESVLRHYDNLSLSQIDGYYIIKAVLPRDKPCRGTKEVTLAQIATKEGLMLWLEERGLALTQELNKSRKTQGIKGEFKTRMYRGAGSVFDDDSWQKIRQQHHSSRKWIKLLVKSTSKRGQEYTLGLVKTDEEGIKTIHYIGPCSHRPIFDFENAQKWRDKGKPAESQFDWHLSWCGR